MLSGSPELSKAEVVRPTSLQSFRDQVKPMDSPGLDSTGETNGLHSAYVADRFHHQFQATRSLFEAWQPKQTFPRPLISPVSSTSPPGTPTSPVSERIESFSALKKRFENDANNNIQQEAPRATKYSSCNMGNSPRQSWASSSSPGSSRRSSGSSSELVDKSRRSGEMAIVREKIAIAKQELRETNERREVAERAYAEAKHRIISAKQKSKLLRDQIRSTEELVERKEKKINELTKKLGARTIVIEQNRRAFEHYDKDIQNESEWIEHLTEKIEAAREKRRATAAKIRNIAQQISPLNAAISEAEDKKDRARARARRFEDVLTKSTIRLKNARALSADAEKRTSFKGYRIEDVHEKIGQQRERLKRAKSDIGYLEYRKQLLRDQLGETKEDARKILLRLNPYRQQKALGFIYARLPMSEEL